MSRPSFLDCVIPLLAGAQERQIHAQHGDFRAAALSRNANIEAGIGFSRWQRLGEERIPPIGTGRREDIHAFRLNSALICVSARRTVAVEATILGLTSLPSFSTTQSSSSADSYRPTIVPEGSGDQMQLILDDQIWRLQTRPQAA